MKNTTLNRKTATGLHKGAGMYAPRTAKTQQGDGKAFAFNGQMGDGVNKSHGREHLCVNPNEHMVKNPDAINHGLVEANRKGNASDSHGDRMESVGPSVTRDANRMTIATASQGHPVTPHKEAKRFKNSDSIYITKASR